MKVDLALLLDMIEDLPEVQTVDLKMRILDLLAGRSTASEGGGLIVYGAVSNGEIVMCDHNKLRLEASAASRRITGGYSIKEFRCG